MMATGNIHGKLLIAQLDLIAAQHSVGNQNKVLAVHKHDNGIVAPLMLGVRNCPMRF